MSNSITAINDDIDRYVALCKRYNEKVQYTHGSPDCYGEHAKQLRERRRAEKD
jgi:hypothetical protein